MNITDPHAGHNMSNSAMDHGSMDHSKMDHGNMDHSNMDHSNMDHSNMDHSNMDHSNMDHSEMDNGMDHSTTDHGMKMYFHFDNKATILFYGWTTNTAWQMFGSCMAVLIFAALYESLKSFRERLLQKSRTQRHPHDYVRPVPSDDIQVAIAGKTTCSAASQMLSAAHFIQTLLHVLQVVLSYFLMLIFMTYNIWLCLSVAVGAGVGYFLFGWRRGHASDRNEHCH